MVRSDLASELLDLAAHDLAVRAELASKRELFGGYHPDMRDVHCRNADRLGQIHDELSAWPGRGLVGPEASDAAFLIAQHHISDPGFMRRCRDLCAVAVSAGDADPAHLAHLEDRILYFEGSKQRYGTHVGWDEKGTSGHGR